MEIKAFKAISDSVVSVVLEQHPYHFEFGVIRHFTIKTGQNIFGRPDSKASNICDGLKLILFGNEITINKKYFVEIDFKTCRYEYEWFTNRKNNFLESFTKKFGVGIVMLAL